MTDPIIEHVRNTKLSKHDVDLSEMPIEKLREEIVVLRNAVRLHRDERGNDRCWIDDARLYGALPEKIGATSQLPQWPEFQANCRRFWELRQCAGAGKADCGK